MFQTKDQEKSSETNTNETALYDLPDRELRITFIKMLTKVRKTMHELRT